MFIKRCLAKFKDKEYETFWIVESYRDNNKIKWVDSSKEEKKVDAAEANLTHKFESRGTIEIKFEVIDSIGRSKKAIFKLKVK